MFKSQSQLQELDKDELIKLIQTITIKYIKIKGESNNSLDDEINRLLLVEPLTDTMDSLAEIRSKILSNVDQGLTVEDDLNTILDMIKVNRTNLKSAINAIFTKITGSDRQNDDTLESIIDLEILRLDNNDTLHNSISKIEDLITSNEIQTNISSTLMATFESILKVNSMPNCMKSFKIINVTSYTGDFNNYISLTINSSEFSGNYSHIWNGAINLNSIVEFTKNELSIRFIIGETINSLQQLENYFKYNYPPSLTISFDVLNILNNLKYLSYGNNNTSVPFYKLGNIISLIKNDKDNILSAVNFVKDKIASNVNIDEGINKVSEKLTSVPSVNLESTVDEIIYKITDSGNLNDAITNAINIVGSTNLIDENITLLAGISSINTAIGGSEIDLIRKIGNVNNDISTGLSTLIGKDTDIDMNSTPFVSKSFTFGSDLNTALTNFLALFDTNNLPDGHTKVTIDLSGGIPTTLAQLISKISSSS